jgi:hypothetical protein
MTTTIRTAALLSVAVLLAGCESLTESPQRQPLAATLDGESVKPSAVTTTGSGAFTATIESFNDEVTLTWSLNFTGLAGTATAVHLHGPASADGVADVILDFAALPPGASGQVTLGATSGSGQGTLDLGALTTALGESVHVLLDAGRVYVDVHTTTRADGEVRGQILKR